MRTLPSKGAAFAELIGDRTFLVIDIETTQVEDTHAGKYAPLRPISVACVVVKNDTVREEHHWLIDPGIPIDETSSAYNGLTDADVAGADDPATVIDRLVAVIDAHPGAPFVAHNAGFDIGALRDEAERVGALFTTRWVYDTATLGSHIGVDELPAKVSLKALIERYGVRLAKRPSTHKAAVDALATTEVLYWLLAEAAERGHSEWAVFSKFIDPQDSLTIPASYAKRMRKPTPPVIASDHFHDAHAVLLPSSPTKADLDTWMAQATECVRLRCAVLPEKVKAETAHLDLLLPRLTGLLTGCVTPGEVGTLLGGMEPLFTLLDQTKARNWYKAHHQAVKDAPRCTSTVACPSCVAEQPCPQDVAYQLLVKRAIGHGSNTLRSRRSRNDLFKPGAWRKMDTWPRAGIPEFAAYMMWLVVREYYDENNITRARDVLLLAKERGLHLEDPRLAYEMCRYLAEQPNKRNQAAVERIMSAMRGKASTDPGFIELEAWHTFTFLPAVKRAEAKKAAVAAKKVRGKVAYKRKPSKVELRPEVQYAYHYQVYKAE